MCPRCLSSRWPFSDHYHWPGLILGSATNSSHPRAAYMRREWSDKSSRECDYVVTCDGTGTDTSGWLNARLTYLQCVSNGDTAVLHPTIDFTIEVYEAMIEFNCHMFLTSVGRLMYSATRSTDTMLFSNSQDDLRVPIACRENCNYITYSWLGARLQ